MLDVVLLVVCVLVTFATVLYLFYWNRIIGALLGWALRWVLWDKSSGRVWVDFGSVHLSLPTGRLMFRNLRYHSSNQTFKVVKCQVSWRYWIRRVAEEEDLADELLSGRSAGDGDSAGGSRYRHTTPKCRIHVSMEGFEWFMYNRTAAFEHILAQMTGTTAHGVRSRESNNPSLNPSVNERGLASIARRRTVWTLRLPAFVIRMVSWIRRQLPDLNPMSLLPVSIAASKGAIILGNRTTESLLMAQFAEAEGTYGIVQTRSKFDLYKQLLRVKFEGVHMTLVENSERWASIIEVGEEVRKEMSKVKAQFSLVFKDFQRIWSKCRSTLKYFGKQWRKQAKAKAQSQRSKGRARTPSRDDPLTAEYAIDRKILEAPTLELVYYADVAGLVPEPRGLVHNYNRAEGVLRSPDGAGLEHMDIGNVDTPPEWGLDIVVKDGSIHYGPWADRQRAQIQRVFFPPSYHNSIPTPLLRPGDLRTCTCLKMYFEFTGTTTLHIPFREASKNWQWDAQSSNLRVDPSRKREAASIQVKMTETSSLKYLVPMFATEAGYLAELRVYLNMITVASSLNDTKLLDAKSYSLLSDLPSPLEWSAERAWVFDIAIEKPNLFLFRDHINMFTDLARDWSTGPPHDFNTYIPMIYGVKMAMNQFELNLYANDHNVIDKPLSRDDNALFTLTGPTLQAEVLIPSNMFRPLSTTVSFDVRIPEAALSVTLPRWNTHTLRSPELLRDVARARDFDFVGSYQYYSEVDEEHLDQLKLQVSGRSPALKLFGWVIRHTMILRDNYFGSFTHYSTTREYLYKRANNLPVGDPIDEKYRPGKSNGFHMDLTLLFQDCTLVLPSGLPGYEFALPAGANAGEHGVGSSLVVGLPEVQVQIRLHDYFMELSINVDPLDMSVTNNCTDFALFRRELPPMKKVISIDGISITGNRLFGPQPRTSTYVCIWNIDIGKILGLLTEAEGRIVLRALRSFSHNYADPYNAPAKEYNVVDDRDATFVKLSINSVDCAWRAPPACLRISASDAIKLSYNTLAGTAYRKSIGVEAPSLRVQLLLANRASKQWLEAGSLDAGVALELYQSPAGWVRDAEEQRKFLSIQDHTTGRFAALMSGSNFITQHHPTRRTCLFLPKLECPQVFTGQNPHAQKARQSRIVSEQRSRSLHRQEAVRDDSDEEYLISETVRDERLANSRPTAFSDEEDIIEDHSSTIDESDEISSISSSDSLDNFSDFGEGEPSFEGDGRWPYSVLYWKYCRRYTGLSTSSLSSWEVSLDSSLPLGDRPFAMRASGVRQHKQSNESSDGLQRQERQGHSLANDTNSESLIRVATSRHCDLFVTPLIVMALRHLLRDYFSDSSSASLRLDDMSLDTPKPPTPKLATMMLETDLDCHIQFIQDITTRTAQTGRLNNADLNGNRSMSVLEMTLSKVQLLSAIPSDQKAENTVFRAGVDQITTSLGRMTFTPTSSKFLTHTPSSVLEWDLRQPSFALTGRCASLTVGSSALGVREGCQDVLFTSVLQARDLSQNISKYARSQAKQSKALLQLRMRFLLGDKGRVQSRNVLSAVQPSFFVQSGKPLRLREDLSWRFLFHLRDQPSSADWDAASFNAGAEDTLNARDELLRTVHDRQTSWVADNDRVELTDIPVLKILFETRAESSGASERPFQALDLLHFRCGRSSVMLLDVNDGRSSDQTAINITNISFSMTLLDKTIVIPVVSLSPSSMVARKYSPDTDYTGESTATLLARLEIDGINIAIYPNIIATLQTFVHAWREHVSLNREISKVVKSDSRNSSWKQRYLKGIVAVEAHVSLSSVILQAAAENMIFELSTERLHTSTFAMLSKPNFVLPDGLDIALSHSSTVKTFSIKARARASSTHSDVLAAVTSRDGAVSLVFQSHSQTLPIARCVLHTSQFQISVPRSAIRLYYFIEQWRQDYLPGLGEMLRALATEFRGGSPSPRKRKRADTIPIFIHFHGSADLIEVSLQVMHGTWLSWKIYDTITYAKASPSSKDAYTYGMQFTRQKISVSSVSSPVEPTSRSSTARVALEMSLPTISASGSFNHSDIELRVLVKILRVNFKPAHWDALLSVQQKFGSDFNDLLLIISENRRKRRVKLAGSPDSISVKRKSTVKVHAKLEGFNISMESPTAVQFLECHDIDATLNTLAQGEWEIRLTNLSAYLDSKASLKSDNRRRNHFVFITADLHASDRAVKRLEDVGDEEQRYLRFAITMLHAVMQPSSINELGSFIDHIQTEILLRKEQRALELQEFKDKARKVMETFNINPTPMAIHESSFLGKRCIEFTMENFGAAFPLTLNQPGATAIDSGVSSSKAFLFSIRSVRFQTHRGETGQAVIKDFSFQFVAKFRHHVAEDFKGESHQTLNRLLYPEMTARVQSDTTISIRRLFFVAGISGFVLDIDPSITDYMFSLVDVYRHGKLQVEKLASAIPKSPSASSAYSPLYEFSNESRDSKTTALRSIIQASLKFLSGTVRMHGSSIGASLPSVPSSYTQTYSKLASEAEIFGLPELSVWCEYRNDPRSWDGLLFKDQSPSVAIVKCTVHSSRNTLRPTLLPFVTEIVKKFEDRMRKSPWRSSRRTSTNTLNTQSLPSPQTIRGASRQAMQSSLQISFSLRIDQSRLELTCKPDVNVTAGLHWQSGGFVVLVSPGAQSVSVLGTVEGLTIGLKHGFLTEECLQLDAKDLSFAVSFTKTELYGGSMVNSISVVVDTEFAGGVRFTRLQDFLCFKAVWLDRIPIINNNTTQGNERVTKLEKVGATEVDQPTSQGFSTAIAIRVRRIRLEADLGQSISVVVLDLTSVRLGTRLTQKVSDICVSVDQVDVKAQGNLSGYVRMPDFFFKTVRKREGPSPDDNGRNNMLQLSLTSGALDILLRSDLLWLLQYRAEPLEAHVYDDWDLIRPDSTSSDHRLRLYFTVRGTKVFGVMTILAIPKLVIYVGKFIANLDAQREGASRESSVFRATRLPKPENALSEVATAMFQTARSRLKESESLTYIIEQHIQLTMDQIVFVLLPRSQSDNELARFVTKDVKAELQRTVVPNGPPADRNLLLSLASMSISQLIRPSFDHRIAEREFDTLVDPSRPSTVVENIIFALPAMVMRMVANEDAQDGRKYLIYDFDSSFVRKEGQKSLDNINISFNIALYSWLTTLHKTFTREMNRAQDAADARSGFPTSPQMRSPGRFNSPEAILPPSISDSPVPTRPTTPTRDTGKTVERGILSPRRAPSRLDPISTSPFPARSSPTSNNATSPIMKQPSSSSSAILPAIKVKIPDTDKTDARAGLPGNTEEPHSATRPRDGAELVYKPRNRRIERLTVRQLGEATPDVMHPFFTRKAGFNLEEALPQYVHEYATLPLEEIMKALVKLYSRQLRIGRE